MKTTDAIAPNNDQHLQHGITDTEYAKLLAQGYDPNLEYQLVELGESLEEACC